MFGAYHRISKGGRPNCFAVGFKAHFTEGNTHLAH